MSKSKAEDNSRMKKLFLNKKLDRVPVNMSISTYAARICNMSSYEYYLNPRKAYEAQIWAKYLHGHDAGPSYNIPNGTVLDFGGDLKIPETDQVSLPKVTKRRVESPEDLAGLEVPNPKESIYAKKRFEFNSILRKNGLKISISAGSPLGVASDIADIQLLMRWMYQKPELVHRLLRIATDYLLEVANWFIKEFGAENCSAFSTYPNECHALLSPEMFAKFSLPYVKEIHNKLINKGVKRWTIHLCGNHTNNLTYWINEIKLAPRSLISIGGEMDIKHVAETFGKEHIVGGNLDTTLLQIGSPKEVYIEAKRIINKMKYNPGGFVLMPACALPPLTPSANLQALIKAVNDFGKYD